MSSIIQLVSYPFENRIFKPEVLRRARTLFHFQSIALDRISGSSRANTRNTSLVLWTPRLLPPLRWLAVSIHQCHRWCMVRQPVIWVVDYASMNKSYQIETPLFADIVVGATKHGRTELRLAGGAAAANSPRRIIIRRDKQATPRCSGWCRRIVSHSGGMCVIHGGWCCCRGTINSVERGCILTFVGGMLSLALGWNGGENLWLEKKYCR